MKEQIESLATFICDTCRERTKCENTTPCTMADIVAKAIVKAGWCKQNEWISVEDDLPNEGEDLLIWIGSAKSARIRKGITEEERQKMRNGELPNPKNEYWCGSKGYVSIERSEIHKEEDIWGNNLVPYCWELDGGYTLFGQQVKYWMPLPEAPKMKGGK